MNLNSSVKQKLEEIYQLLAAEDLTVSVELTAKNSKNDVVMDISKDSHPVKQIEWYSSTMDC